MDFGVHHVIQIMIHQAVPRQAVLPFKSGGYQAYPEVAAAGRRSA